MLKIRRRNMPLLVVAGAVVGIGLALLAALLAGVGTARAVECVDGVCCDPVMFEGPASLCGGPLTCWGPDVEAEVGCERVVIQMNDPSSCEACTIRGAAALQAAPEQLLRGLLVGTRSWICSRCAAGVRMATTDGSMLSPGSELSTTHQTTSVNRDPSAGHPHLFPRGACSEQRIPHAGDTGHTGKGILGWVHCDHTSAD